MANGVVLYMITVGLTGLRQAFGLGEDQTEIIRFEQVFVALGSGVLSLLLMLCGTSQFKPRALSYFPGKEPLD